MKKKYLETWVKAKEGLSWKHIWDTEQFIARLYSVHTGNVPAGFLLDKEGKIIKKGLRGTTLSKEIHKLVTK